VRSEGALSDSHVSIFLEEAATFILYLKFIHRATQPVILEDQNVIFTTLPISCCNIIIFNITGCSYNKIWIPTAVVCTGCANYTQVQNNISKFGILCVISFCLHLLEFSC